jgi:hypothetical protein
MVYIEPGTSAYVEGYGTLNVYNNEEEANAAGESGNLLVPQENLSGQYWTDPNLSDGSVRAMEAVYPGGRSIYAVSARAPGVTDYTLESENYSDAYEGATGMKLPGALPAIPMFIIYLIALAMVLITVAWIACAIIAASTVNTSEATTDPNTGDTIYRSCIGNPLGGTKCVYYNATTGKTSDAGGTGGINDVLNMVILGAVVLGGLYVAVKIIPKAFERRPTT